MPLPTNVQHTLHVLQVAEGGEYGVNTWLVLSPPVFSLSTNSPTFPTQLRLVDTFNNFIGLAIIQHLHAHRAAYIDLKISMRTSQARRSISAHLLVHSIHIKLRVIQKLEQFLITIVEPAFFATAVIPSADVEAREVITDGSYSHTRWSRAALRTLPSTCRPYSVLAELYAVGQFAYGSTFSLVTTEGRMRRGDEIYLRRCRDGMLMSPTLVVGGCRRLNDGRIEFWALNPDTKQVCYLISMMHDVPATIQTMLTFHVHGLIFHILVGVLIYIWSYITTARHFETLSKPLVGDRASLTVRSTRHHTYGTASGR